MNFEVNAIDGKCSFVLYFSQNSLFSLRDKQERLDADYASKNQRFPVYVDFPLDVQISSSSRLFSGLDTSSAKLYYNVSSRRFTVQNHSIISEEFDLY